MNEKFIIQQIAQALDLTENLRKRETQRLKAGIPIHQQSMEDIQAIERRLKRIREQFPYSKSPDQPNCVVISIPEPQASLIAWGIQQYHVLDWATDYRGRILIQAANQSVDEDKLHQIFHGIAHPNLREFQPDLTRGNVLAIATLTDCIWITDRFIQSQSSNELVCEDWQLGDYAWKLTEVCYLTEMVSAPTKSGLWIPDDRLIAEIEQLSVI